MLNDAQYVKVTTENEEEILENLESPTLSSVLKRNKGTYANSVSAPYHGKTGKMAGWSTQTQSLSTMEILH